MRDMVEKMVNNFIQTEGQLYFDAFYKIFVDEMVVLNA
jgi:hypothetical protein